MTRDRDTDDLLSAYLDGVTELTPDERRRVEARLADDPELRDDADATRALLGQLRELPPEGAEPDWRAMERAIHAEVGDAAPRPWWKRWTWIAPAAALAMAAAVLALVLGAPERSAIAPSGPDAGVARGEEPGSATDDDTLALWLDGAPLEVDVADVDLIDDAALATVGDHDGESSDGGAETDAEALAELAAPGADLMTPGDLAWIDELGEDDIAAAEAWLARKKS